MNYDWEFVELIASQICHLQGGNWDRPKTHKNHWRQMAMKLIAMSRGCVSEKSMLRIFGRGAK